MLCISCCCLTKAEILGWLFIQRGKVGVSLVGFQKHSIRFLSFEIAQNVNMYNGLNELNSAPINTTAQIYIKYSSQFLSQKEALKGLIETSCSSKKGTTC